MVLGNEVTTLPYRKSVPVYINGFEEKPEWLSWRPKKYLLSVNLIRGTIAKIMCEEHDPAIWVMTSDDTLMKSLVRHSIEFTPLGVSLAKEFYQPRYDVDSVRYNHEQRDTRTTLYWEPRLAFRAGEEKKIHFYTNDKRGTYFVVIEGITREGIPIRQVQRIKLE